MPFCVILRPSLSYTFSNRDNYDRIAIYIKIATIATFLYKNRYIHKVFFSVNQLSKRAINQFNNHSIKGRKIITHPAKRVRMPLPRAAASSWATTHKGKEKPCKGHSRAIFYPCYYLKSFRLSQSTHRLS